MPYGKDHPDSLNLVILSGSSGWKLDAFDQARELGLGSIRTARSPQEAMDFLAERSPHVSHLLLQPMAAGNQLGEILDITADRHDGITLVVLGETLDLPPHLPTQAVTYVPRPSHGWLGRALAQNISHRPGRGTAGGPTLGELTAALSAGRLQTRYQPIVRLDDGHPVGLEVLARMEHPKYGVLSPDLFVPQIEDAGLAWPLTQAVITRAFTDWSTGRLGSFGLTLALNFPLDVLLVPEALAWLETRRRQAGLPADRVVIELTESRPISELSSLRHATSTLRGIGYGLAIDDVGPHTRDHQGLLDLQFTTLKLDKDLVCESATLPAASAFLMDTIAAARAAHLTIVAEGVETDALWQRMKDLGVEQAQGYLVARPLLATTVPLWYNDWISKKRRPPVTYSR